MGRKILSVIVAFIVATAIMMIVEMLNSLQLAPPSDEIMKDPVKLAAYMAAGPARAYIVVLIGYVLASFAGGFVVTNALVHRADFTCTSQSFRRRWRALRDRRA